MLDKYRPFNGTLSDWSGLLVPEDNSRVTDGGRYLIELDDKLQGLCSIKINQTRRRHSNTYIFNLVYSLLNEMLKKDKTKNCSVMKAFPIVYQEPWQLKLPEFTEVPVLHEGNKPLRPVALRRFVREMRRNRAGIRKCLDHTQQ